MPTPAETSRCSRCGAAKPAGSPCPHCLLQLGLSLPPGDSEGAPRASLPEPAELARHFPGLEILELVARGGMGAVYRAHHKKLDRPVALKILAPELSGDAAFAERFLREARAMARLDHPNIVAVHDFGESEGLCWLLMEFVDGVNLRQAMANGGLTPAQALAIVPQLCDALPAAHHLGVVQRVIKPDNGLLERAGEVKIADFGLAKLSGAVALEPQLTRTDAAMGTLHYMAPEQLLGSRAVDHRADIFSLGVVFYEMLTGQLPLGSFEPPSKRVEVDVRLDEIVLRTLAQEPERRYQRAAEVKTDVQAVSTKAPEKRVEVAPARAAAGPGQAAPATRGSSGEPLRRWAIDGPGRFLIWLLFFPTTARLLLRFEASGLVLLVALFSLWMFLETRIQVSRHAVLATIGARWTRLQRASRVAGFLLFAALGSVILGAGVEATWQHGTDHYVSPAAHLQRLAEPRSADGGYALLELLEPGRTNLPELAAPGFDRYHRRQLTSQVGTYLLAALALLAAGAVLGSVRGQVAWRVTLAPLTCAALVLAWSFVFIQLKQIGLVETQNGVVGSVRIQADVERVRVALARRLAAGDNELVLEAGGTLLEKRTREPLARHELLAATPRSPFERWKLAHDGPVRVRPDLVFELVGSLDGATTVLTWDAGLVREGERENRLWRNDVERLLGEVESEAES